MQQRRIVGFAVGALVIFLAGFVPTYLKARSLDREVAEMRRHEQVCRLRETLGAAFLQVTLRNYGVAQENASTFFTEARRVASATDEPALRSTLEALLAQRDDLAAKLGRGAAEAYPEIQQMYRTLVEQTASTPPGTAR